MPPEKSNAATGAELNRLVEEFLATVSDWSQVKVTTLHGSFLLAHFIRCRPFQDFLRVIQDRAVCAQLSHQHDAILRFLNRVFFGGGGELEVPSTPVAGDTGTISTHDLVVDGIACQFKTMNNVSDAGVVTFLRKNLLAIRRNAARVPRWWLGFLRNISPPKSRKGHPCFTYLVLVEVAADRVLHAPNAVLEAEVISLVQQAQAKVKREDNIGDGFLLPVKNVWIVTQLKEELAEKEEAIAEKDKVIAAKDETIAERDKVIAQREKEIAALKKRLEQEK